VLKLPAQLTHDRAEACVADLRKALPNAFAEAGPGQSAMLDAGALEHFDSSALAVLLACRRMALDAGRGLTIQGLPPRLRQLAGLYGIAELIPASPAAD
jgi:phospholipid transport system transporter-binding protein